MQCKIQLIILSIYFIPSILYPAEPSKILTEPIYGYSVSIYNGKVSGYSVYLYNGKEYVSKYEIGKELGKEHDSKKYMLRPGESIGYRQYQNEKIVEEITGTVSNEGKLILSNGVEFSIEDKTIFEVFERMFKVLAFLNTYDYGYFGSKPMKEIRSD